MAVSHKNLTFLTLKMRSVKFWKRNKTVENLSNTDLYRLLNIEEPFKMSSQVKNALRKSRVVSLRKVDAIGLYQRLQ